MSRPTVLYPLYVYPSPGAWLPLLQAIQAFPTVRTLLILDVNNGELGGTNSTDINYKEAIQELDFLGISWVAYVHTKYGQRTAAQVIADMDAWVKLYPSKTMKGFFVDEVASTGAEQYLLSLVIEAHHLGFSIVIANPGVPIPASYLGICSAYIIYEGDQVQTHTFPFFSDLGPKLFSPPSTVFGTFEKNCTEWFVNSGLGYEFQTAESGYTVLDPNIGGFFAALAASPQ